MLTVQRCLLALSLASFLGLGRAAFASSFAGSTSTAIFPPPGASVGAEAAFFPDAAEVGFAGPTPTGDEAEAIQTAPVIAENNNIFPLIKPTTADKQPNFDITQHWGNLSPWQSQQSFGLQNATPVIPSGCMLNQVHLVHRHGARYPTSGEPASVFPAELQAAVQARNVSASGPLTFLNTWTFKLGAELLTPFGRSQLFNLGIGFRVKYGDLLKDFHDLPVFRTTSEERMVDSALHFAAGFFGVQQFQEDYHQLIIIEADGFNNTLNPPGVCTNANTAFDFGQSQAQVWGQIYLQTALKRLQPFISGFTFQLSDMFAMQQLCAYETVALGFSAFCDLFTEEEWKGFEYFSDLAFWYGNGPGNPSTSAQGIGYVQELVSRLTQTTLTQFNSTTNGTLDGNPITFPLNQAIYVDATHDTVLSTIFPAMNFTSFTAGGPLPLTHIPVQQTYISSQIVPFGSNLVGQVLSCSSSNTPTHIRWIINDAVVPLTGVNGCKADPNGLCDFNTFIAAMKQRIQEVDFSFDCFANITVPNPDQITTGQLPANLKQ
ncbi:phosphoglycerate mutase-like protein [Pluteus cervinus]|uniref:Phosphoglycerate mutase-like protein n=1 Tax=Pluteus cervinus TaxID=181527 RepID=A0ACD3BH47_9AGAR|nr:phosphoglycerate mutase-like protein [Pluteus cervinus]